MNRSDGLTAALVALTALGMTGCGGAGTSLEDPVDAIRKRLASKGAHEPYMPDDLPGIYLDESMVPEDNPITPAKVELGRQLYHDPRLSKDRSVSCASCHHPALGWTDQAPVSTGIGGQKGGRSSPTVMNRIMGVTQFWDGRAASLEEQALGPIGNPIEMGFSVEEAAKRLNEIEGYRIQFEAIFGPAEAEAGESAFGGPATPDRMAKAIATFERTVLAGGAPNDYYERAEPFLNSEPEEDEEPDVTARREKALADWKKHEMSASALRGRDVYFDKGRCSLCHVGPNLADERFHNLGVGMLAEKPDRGREDHTKEEKDRGAFKTPTLRNIADTAPYMHDGSQETLEEVVEFYDKGGHENPWLAPNIQPLNLTDQEKADLVQFMVEGLQGEVTGMEIPLLPPDPDGSLVEPLLPVTAAAEPGETVEPVGH